MKNLLALLTVVVCVSAFPLTSLAQETPVAEKEVKQKKSRIERVQKLLESVTLTEEQDVAFKEATEKFSAELKVIEGNGLTKELFKMRSEKMKAGKAEGIKKKDLSEHAMQGFSEEEVGLFESYQAASKDFLKTVGEMLTEEQLAELPKKAQMQFSMKEKGKGKQGKAKNAGKGKKGKGKGKKAGKGKKKADADEGEATEEVGDGETQE